MQARLDRDRDSLIAVAPHGRQCGAQVCSDLRAGAVRACVERSEQVGDQGDRPGRRVRAGDDREDEGRRLAGDLADGDRAASLRRAGHGEGAVERGAVVRGRLVDACAAGSVGAAAAAGGYCEDRTDGQRGRRRQLGETSGREARSTAVPSAFRHCMSRNLPLGTYVSSLMFTDLEDLCQPHRSSFIRRKQFAGPPGECGVRRDRRDPLIAPCGRRPGYAAIARPRSSMDRARAS